MKHVDFDELAANIKTWAANAGFQEARITNVDLSPYEKSFKTWIKNKFHGEMVYMERNQAMRLHPEKLLPATIRVISVRMDYKTTKANSLRFRNDKNMAYISHYARGRDYHKLVRKRLESLARKITVKTQQFGYRAFADSAPILERALAEKAGQGWIGKNTMLINKKAGSWFFLGELFTDIPLPIDEPTSEHCGSCSACIEACPTNAFVEPNLLDATRCISYLTIESRSSIPEEFRSAIGNRIFGCDDCQLVCPWNKFSKPTAEADFSPRHNFDNVKLVQLFTWTQQEFYRNTEGSPIRRIGYDCWKRNIAIALGNAETSNEIIHALKSELGKNSPMVREHIEWALFQHRAA
tara:strand:- start:439 stop:1494 length:1056 start_codon:yes stop_codon:yes gene_type:complete